MSSIAVALFFFSLLLCLPFPSLPEMHKPGVYTYSDRMYSNLTQILLQIVLRFSVKKLNPCGYLQNGRSSGAPALRKDDKLLRKLQVGYKQGCQLVDSNYRPFLHAVRANQKISERKKIPAFFALNLYTSLPGNCLLSSKR